MKYKVGDKVRIVNKWNCNTCESTLGGMDKYLGKVLTVSQVKGTCYYMRESGGYVWNDACIVGLAKKEKKIVITSDGVETLARLYDGNKVIKTATEKCSPDDTFDFEVGARTAFDRLIESKITLALKSFSMAAAKAAEDIAKKFKPVEKKPDPAEEKWRVVDRKVRAGDYIRLKCNDYGPLADVGDVLKVHCVGGHLAKIRNKDMTRPMKGRGDDYCWNYWFSEFEVVEPVEKEEKPLKIEVGRKYLSKPYDDVYPLGISRETWAEIASHYVEVLEDRDDTAFAKDHTGVTWYIKHQSFEKEYIEEKPFKFEVGKQYKGSNTRGEELVIKITRRYSEGPVNRYEYEVVAGKDYGSQGFEEVSCFADRLTPYDPPKYYNGKVVCVKSAYPIFWTVGKVYDVKNGTITRNTGGTIAGLTKEGVLHAGDPKNEFIPIVE